MKKQGAITKAVKSVAAAVGPMVVDAAASVAKTFLRKGSASAKVKAKSTVRKATKATTKAATKKTTAKPAAKKRKAA